MSSPDSSVEDKAQGPAFSSSDLRHLLAGIEDDVEQLLRQLETLERKISDVNLNLSDRVAAAGKPVESSVQNLRDEIVRTRTLVDEINRRPSGWPEVAQKLDTTSGRLDKLDRNMQEDLSRRIQEIEKRTPRVMYWIGMVLLIVTVLGFDGIQAVFTRVAVNNTSQNLDNTSTKLERTSDSILSVKNEVENTCLRMKDRFTDLQRDVEVSVNAALKKITDASDEMKTASSKLAESYKESSHKATLEGFPPYVVDALRPVAVPSYAKPAFPKGLGK